MANPLPLIPRVESLELGRELSRLQHDPPVLVELALRSDSKARAFLQSLTFIAKSPEGWTLPEHVAIALIAGVSQLNSEGDPMQGVTLVIGGALSQSRAEEIIRKAHVEQLRWDQVGADAIVAKLQAEGLFDPPKVIEPEKPTPVLDMILGIGYVLAIIAAVFWVISWFSSD